MDIDDPMRPFGVDIDFVNGVIEKHEQVIIRRASDMRGYYADEAALERLIADRGDPVHYEVFEKAVPEQRGHLMLCVSKLQPGLVGQEYFMTKGHYHAVPDTAEIYFGIRGAGHMLMKTAGGHYAVEPLKPGRLVYVPPHWGHRSVNTGDEPLISLCIYPAEAGHNYGDIKQEGFPTRLLAGDAGESGW